MINRRHFIQGTSASIAFAGYPISGITRDLPEGNLIVLILEGGMDGLTAVPPIGDKNLQRLRGEAVAQNLIPLGSDFGLHPSLSKFAKILVQGNAIIVHATNFPYKKRSHFEGQNIIESGSIIPFKEKTGWLGRALDHSKLAGKALALDMPLIIRGTTDIDNYYPADLAGSSNPESDILNLLSKSYEIENKQVFQKIAKKFEQQFLFARDNLSLAQYVGTQMRQELGPKAAIFKINEFDTHSKQGSDFGPHSERLKQLDDIFYALKKSLGDAWKNTIIMTVTEFGRTVKLNGSEGTDHGYGSVGFLAGGLINKSKIVTKWPGLEKKELFEERDLNSTIDYRSVCSACIETVFGLGHEIIASEIFYEKNLPRITDELFS